MGERYTLVYMYDASGNVVGGDLEADDNGDWVKYSPAPSLPEDAERMVKRLEMWGDPRNSGIGPSRELYREAAAFIQSLSSQLAEARAEQERQWCLSCGSVTRDGECDCTKLPDCSGPQRLVNYADAVSAERDRLAAENERLRQLFDDYGDHHEGCDLAQPDCSCGMRQRFRAALLAARKEPKK